MTRSKKPAKLSGIIVSEWNKNRYHVSLSYNNNECDPGLEMPKNMDYLKGYICGIFMGSKDHDWDIEITNYNEKCDLQNPLPEKDFKEISEYINAWMFSGLAPD